MIMNDDNFRRFDLTLRSAFPVVRVILLSLDSFGNFRTTGARLSIQKLTNGRQSTWENDKGYTPLGQQ